MAGRVTVLRATGLALGCLVALAGGIALAYWQWTRYESIDGTLQNLGYVLQWPLFGVFPAIMVWRIYRVAKTERARRAEEREQAAPEPAAQPEPAAPRSRMAYVAPTVDDQPAPEDPVLARYNGLLAQLSDEEAQRTAAAATHPAPGTNRGSP